MMRSTILLNPQQKQQLQKGICHRNSQSNRQIYYNQNTISAEQLNKVKNTKIKTQSINTKSKTKSNCSKKNRDVSQSINRVENRKRNKSKTKSLKTIKNSKTQKGLLGKSEKKKERKFISKSKNKPTQQKEKMTLSQKQFKKSRNFKGYESEYGNVHVQPKISRSKRMQTCLSKQKINDTWNSEFQKIEIPVEPLGMRTCVPLSCTLDNDKQPYWKDIQPVGVQM